MLLFLTALQLLSLPGCAFYAAVVTAWDPIFQVACGPLIAKRVDRIVAMAMRLKVTQWCQVAAGVGALTILALLNTSMKPLWLVLATGVYRLIGSADAQLRAGLPLELAIRKITPLVTSVSWLQTFGRGLYLASSVLAVVLLKAPLTIVLLLVLACHLSSGLAYRALRALFHTSPPHPLTDVSTTGPATSGRWKRWNAVYLLLINFSVGAVAFVLLRAVDQSRSNEEPVWIQVLSGPAPVYAGFLLTTCLLGFMPSLGTRLCSSLTKLCLLTSGVGVFLTMIVFLPSPVAHLLPLLLCGVLYGAALISLQGFVQPRLGSTVLTSSLAAGQAMGRLGSIGALVLAGMLLAKGVPPALLLTSYGLLAIGSAAICWTLGARLPGHRQAGLSELSPSPTDFQ